MKKLLRFYELLRIFVILIPIMLIIKKERHDWNIHLIMIIKKVKHFDLKKIKLNTAKKVLK